MVILICFVFPYRKLFTFKLGIQNMMEISATLWSMTRSAGAASLCLGIYPFEGHLFTASIGPNVGFLCLWAAAGNLISVTWLNFQPKTTWWGMSDEICRPQIRGPEKFQSFDVPNCPFQSDQIVIILDFWKLKTPSTALHFCLSTWQLRPFGLESWNLGNPNFGLQNVEKAEWTKSIAANKCYSTQSGYTDVYASTCQQ